jgi:DNA-binding transcriptional regulator YiaG
MSIPDQPIPKKQDLPDEMVTTGVDDLIKLLSEFPKLSIEETAKRLNVSKKVLKSWIDFLVEEKILGIEYTFTTPFIYLNKPHEQEKIKQIREEKLTYSQFKQEFYEKARKSSIPEEKIKGFWQEHLKQRLEQNKEFFFREVQKHNLPRSDELWEKYVRSALG